MKQHVSLGNSFVPSLAPLVITKALSRLSLSSLTNLCILWSQLYQTQPKPSKQQIKELEISRDWLIEDFKKFLKIFKKNKNQSRRYLIDKILVDYYPNGLNLLQFAQLDSQLMIEKPLNFYWQSSKIINSTNNEEEIIYLNDPQIFLNHLLSELSNYYLNHIYISNHPYYPLLIIRIQLFDLISDASNVSDIKNFTTSNSLISRNPIFIALPINSSNIIHSYNQSIDPSMEIVLQCFEIALSKSLDKQLRILKNEDEPPIRSLESLHILKGNSRFSESLGPWAPYADGTIDISPFDDVKIHSTFQKNGIENITIDERRKKIAFLKFKGTINSLKSEKLYEDVNNKKRKLNTNTNSNKIINNDSDDENNEDENRNVDKSEYSSITPIQFFQIQLENNYKNFKPKIKLKFQGKDIFGGLHELSDLNIVNPENIPNWLTGQESSFNGIVKDDIFISKSSHNKIEDSTLI